MNEEYKLPSGLAVCEYYNEFTGASCCRLPRGAYQKNKALREALEQLHKMQRLINELERRHTAGGAA